MSTRIAYLGPEGTFSAEAVRAYVQRAAVADAVLMAQRTIPDALQEVARGACDLAVVPAENSIEGSVAVTLDFLVHEVDVPIIGEVVIPVRHYLLGVPGADIAGIRAVYSHPQPLAQCRRHLRELLPQAETRPVASTAAAAQFVQQSGDPALAALGTAAAAGLYHLAILAADLQDESENVTRFFVVGNDVQAKTGAGRTTVVFAFAEDRPGQLYGALRAFAERGINLSKLESRPMRRSLGEYLFFVDIDGYADETPVAQALSELRHQCAMVKVLGSYPRDYWRH